MTSHDPDEAPGRLDLLRLLVNTLNLPDGPDELDTPERASAWCREHGLSLIANQEDCDRLRAFRETIRDVLFANNGEFEPDRAWSELETFAPRAALVVAVENSVPVLRAAGTGVDRVIGELLAVVYEASARGTFQRLRACRKSSCRFAYYDRSKNGSRAWCSMATCGNQEKAQRRRKRERT
jgi:predicted RNA-binding Zn ribbon-like protein